MLNHHGRILVVQHDSTDFRPGHEPQDFVDVVVANDIASLTQGKKNKYTQAIKGRVSSDDVYTVHTLQTTRRSKSTCDVIK